MLHLIPFVLEMMMICLNLLNLFHLLNLRIKGKFHHIHEVAGINNAIFVSDYHSCTGSFIKPIMRWSSKQRIKVHFYVQKRKVFPIICHFCIIYLLLVFLLSAYLVAHSMMKQFNASHFIWKYQIPPSDISKWKITDSFIIFGINHTLPIWQRYFIHLQIIYNNIQKLWDILFS